MDREATYEPEALDEITPSSVHDLVFRDDEPIRSEFLKQYPEQIERAEQGIAKAFEGLAVFHRTLEPNLRNAWIESFLYSAGYSLVAALHHLVSGYPIATGHMLRHFIESMAMALLCADEPSQVFESFTAEPRTYNVASAPTKLRNRKIRGRLENLIGFDATAWEIILKHHGEYSARSHSTQLTIAFQNMLDTDNLRVLGAEFDPAKDAAYQSDLGRIASAGESLHQLYLTLAAALSGREN